MVTPRKVPIRPLTDYDSRMVGSDQFFIGRFEQAITALPNRLRLHRHTYYELFWLNGRGHFFCDFQEYPISGPTLVFVSPGQVHSWQQNPLLTGPMMGFTQEFYDGKEPPPSSLLDQPFWFPFKQPPILSADSPEAATLAPIWQALEAESAPSQERDEIVRAALKVILYKAARLYRNRFETGGSSRPESAPGRLARDFRLALESHFRTFTSVADYAKHLRVTTDQLGVMTRERMGRSPGDIIRERVLLEAKRLLIHTSMNVSEIAYELNFGDPAYFSRFFRRLVHQSPGDFREEFSEKHPN